MEPIYLSLFKNEWIYISIPTHAILACKEAVLTPIPKQPAVRFTVLPISEAKNAGNMRIT